MKRWYWYLGLVLTVYMFTVGLFQFWFRLPLEVAKDPLRGSSYALGVIGVAIFGIWLMYKGGRHKDG